MAQTSPLVKWGTASDISASPWTDSGTPTLTAAQADPFGGTAAVKIDDNDAGAFEARYNTLAALNQTFVEWLVFAKQGTAVGSRFDIWDNTASAYGLINTINWSGGVITSVTANTGTSVGSIALGGGWYAVMGSCSWTSGHVPRLGLYGAGNSSSLTGTTIWYLAQACVFGGQFDAGLAEDLPRPGSQWAQGASGSEDAWVIGTDQRLSGVLRQIPPQSVAFPDLQSGYYGENDYAAYGINCGVKAMLRAGRDKQALTWCPDRAACTTNMASLLVEPVDGGIEREGNGSPNRRVPIVLRGASVYTGY